MNIIKTCPLGHTCQKATADGDIEECMWYTKLHVTRLDTGEPEEIHQCAMVTTPELVKHVINEVRTNSLEVGSIKNLAYKAAGVKGVNANTANKRLPGTEY